MIERLFIIVDQIIGKKFRERADREIFLLTVLYFR
jgi:hypothetical protein